MVKHLLCIYLIFLPYRQGSVVLRSNQKLSPKFFGPYKVVDKIGKVAYKLALPVGSKVHPVFHVSQLKLLVGTVTTSTQLPAVVGDVLLKEPVRILERRMVKRQGRAATKGKETLLLVLVGNWECSTDGWWKFIVETNCLAQCVMVSEDMSFAAVKTRIEEEFATEIEGVVQRMSYCPPSEMSMFASGKTPPVSINSDRGLQTFLKLRAATKPLNLLVTFGCGAETDPRLLKKTATAAPIINLADGTPSIQSADEVDSTYNAVGLATASLGTSVADVRHMVQDNADINGGIDLNNIYDDEMISSLKLLKKWQGRRKDWEMYVRAEEEEYQYNVLNTLGSQEYRPLQVGETMVVGESSNAIRMCSVPESTTDEWLGRVDAVPPAIDNIQVEDDNVVTEGHDGLFFNFFQVRSDKERLIVRCVDLSCPWRVYGLRSSPTSENMEMRTATLTHTCDITSRGQYVKKASCKVIAEVLISKYANGKLGPRAVDIPDIILDELRVSINYMKAWHSKERAVIEARGTAEDSYKLLVVYLHLLKQTNSGTVYDVVTTGYGTSKCKFKYLFFAIGACIHAAQFMRKVLIIDATTIKAKFRGCLLTASFQDVNFQIMPLGFGVVNSENEDAWTWFFTQLMSIVPDADDLVIVSDRHNAIYAAMRKVYPTAKHGSCVVHTEMSRADIGKRYNIMSSNVAESLNAAMAKALEFPIVSMVETIRMMLMRWFYCRRVKANKHLSPVTPEVEEILMKHLSESGGLGVAPASEAIYQVSNSKYVAFIVNLNAKTCSCKVFETLGIPCYHALAAARAHGVPIPEMVDNHYKTGEWINAYSAVLMHVPNVEDADVPQELVDDETNPPQVNPGPDRPKKRRIPSIGETVGRKKKRSNGPSRCSRIKLKRMGVRKQVKACQVYEADAKEGSRLD
ncbi:Zinc finger SWIM-type [Arabidopsis suecica]|uniref:Zinc finger SWIM-type n=1 Tax=Arabidopsis suecica TaxID=45249 RepID=A0A8T2AFW7_ARASU|nr:Zinc finger SWIM-type [Arabidopsis suecica]